MKDLRKFIATTIREYLNESTQINVMGKKFTWNDLKGGKLYHGSRTDLEVGEYLIPQENTNFEESDKSKISITSDYDRAIYWAKQIKSNQPIYIYEVEPIGDIDIWRVSLAEMGTKFTLWEGRVNEAKIINKYIV